MTGIELFLSPSCDFEVLEHDPSPMDELRLVKLLREGNPVIVQVSGFYVPEPTKS